MRTDCLALAFLVACVDPTPAGPDPVGDPGPSPDAEPACADLVPGDEGAFLERDTLVWASREECHSAVHAAAGARGLTLAVRLAEWDADGAARLLVTDLLGDPLAEALMGAGDVLDVVLPRSGEVLVRLEPERADEPSNHYALSVSCKDACDVEYTRYPIVLFHGAAPDDYQGLLDYFFGVDDALAAEGFLVVTPAVHPFASTEERAEEWARHLDDLVDAGIGRRFDIVGHSQGGIDARHVAAHLDPEGRIASIVTIATPHRGSAVADVSAGLIDLSPLADDIVDAAADALAALLGLPPQDAMGALATLNTEAMAAFNAETPDVPGVYYASWAGHSCGILEPACIADQGGEVVTPFLGATYTLLLLTDGPNDGMVPVSSAIWGDYRGEIPADHLDEVGQILDLFHPAFDHRAFYLAEARRLAAMGL